MHRFLGTLKKNQRHPITGCDPDQFAGRATLAELWRRSHNLTELLHHLTLLVYQQFRVTHHVDK